MKLIDFYTLIEYLNQIVNGIAIIGIIVGLFGLFSNSFRRRFNRLHNLRINKKKFLSIFLYSLLIKCLILLHLGFLIIVFGIVVGLFWSFVSLFNNSKIDIYIYKKYLTTFLFSLLLLLLVVIVIDFSEKIDDFMQHDLSFFTIMSEYYLHFIPYFVNLFSPLFIFISVVFFTSRLANNSEIIAIFNSGMSFKRLLRPFIISAVFLSILSFILGSYIIPISNKYLINFENKYLKSQEKVYRKNIHIQKTKDHYYYLGGYNKKKKEGHRFSAENFEKGKLKNKLRAQKILWNEETKKWTLNKYVIRTFEGNRETLTPSKKLRETTDTTLMISPSDFINQSNLDQTMSLHELNKNIESETIKSSGKSKFYKIEKHKRIAFPFAIIILTIIAVALSSKKKKSGIGTNMGLGLLISFSYILFFQFSSTLSINGNLEPWIAVWIPNILYIFLGVLLLRKTQNI